MKITTVKQECNDGDKATIKGTVKWVGEVKTHQGQDGAFRTQSLLVADGERTDDKRNSMFCGFYADKGCWDHFKNQEITVQGTVDVYDGKMSLKSCKIKDDAPQSAPQQGQQAPSQARQPANTSNKQVDTRNTSIERQAAFKAACEYCGRKGLEVKEVVN